MELKPRPRYLDKFNALKDNGLIKVVVGMRRCGKSSLMRLFARSLEEQDVPPERIVQMNFESADCFDILTYRDLVRRVQDKTQSEGRYYLLFDEIQLVESWEKAVNALRVDMDADIYITGSNAYLLSSQLATLLSGRYVEINVFPLSFSEFVEFVGSEDPDKAFERFLSFGGLPPVVEQGGDRALAQTVLSGIYNTVFVKDVAQHVQIRNAAVFNDVACYLADTAGSRVSIANIENRLKSAHRKTSSETIERYLQALVDAFLFYRVRRFDVKGGTFLQGLEKYYPTDLGIKSMLLGFPEGDYGFALENAVCNELQTRGYNVRVGKADALEIDFVATSATETLYVQVSASVIDAQTRQRELAPFKAVAGKQGKKLLLTLDRLGLSVQEGVEVANLIDWLLGC
ncbi:ATP-binding protein [Arabiibacter massiliensis]|uniref:ATP-binding protein n=1 Tax=Arabiibacter massiliensis TaxID=1870985 RepID=UPI0009B93D29|nr:ATP-binding protein [Arabiibacter massiliensis]